MYLDSSRAALDCPGRWAEVVESALGLAMTGLAEVDVAASLPIAGSLASRASQSLSESTYE